ncbi:MAG: DUF3147 family protein [Alphaproteobacteria bacterium]
MYFLLKTLITALVVAAVSELARRYSLFAALIASLPLTSILAFVWLWRDTHDAQKIGALSYDIFWLVLPSLVFFLMLPLLLKHGLGFYPALAVSCVVMAAFYAGFTYAKAMLA